MRLRRSTRFRANPHRSPLPSARGNWDGKEITGTSTDLVGGVNRYKPGVGPYHFTSDHLALVVIPGTEPQKLLQGVRGDAAKANPEIVQLDNGVAMQAACEISFQTTGSALIENYGLPAQADSGKIQIPAKDLLSVNNDQVDLKARLAYSMDQYYSHIFKGNGKLVIETAKTIWDGLRKSNAVYVVAHGQGSEIFRRAIDYLVSRKDFKEEDFKNIYYQGFGAETYIWPVIETEFLLTFLYHTAKDLKGWGKDSAVDVIYKGSNPKELVKKKLCKSVRLGSARNVRTKDDKLPDEGQKRREIVATYEIVQDVVTSLYTGGESAAGVVKKLIEEAFKKEFFTLHPTQHSLQNDESLTGLIGIQKEHWEPVNAPLPLHQAPPDPRMKGQGARYYICQNKDPDPHNFIIQYWALQPHRR